MRFSTGLALLAPLLADFVWSAGLYGKNSAVLQISEKDYKEKIKLHDKASIIEFYAPWCGHCQSLKPAYEKAAKALKGLANVAAVNCDEDENKAFCGTMGIKGFPTLKTVRQTGTYGRPIILEYNGGRSASDIAEAVKALIPNIVEKVDDKGLEEFLRKANDTPKAILFSDKGTTAALTKVLANEYETHLRVGQIRNKHVKANEMFGITEYPTLVVLPGGNKPPVFYDGKLEKDPMNKFLDQYAGRFDKKAASKPKPKPDAKKSKKYSGSASSEFAKASASHASEDAEHAQSSPVVASNGASAPDTETPTSVAAPDVPVPLQTLKTEPELAQACLGAKTVTCILALIPPGSADTGSSPTEATTLAVKSLENLAHKHKKRSHLFPFFVVPGESVGASSLKSSLELRDGDVQIVAINGKRGWWLKYPAEKGFDEVNVEAWIDGIRFGEGTKGKLPDAIIHDEAETKAEDKPKDTADGRHDEL